MPYMFQWTFFRAEPFTVGGIECRCIWYLLKYRTNSGGPLVNSALWVQYPLIWCGQAWQPSWMRRSLLRMRTHYSTWVTRWPRTTSRQLAAFPGTVPPLTRTQRPDPDLKNCSTFKNSQYCTVVVFSLQCTFFDLKLSSSFLSYVALFHCKITFQMRSEWIAFRSLNSTVLLSFFFLLEKLK